MQDHDIRAKALTEAVKHLNDPTSGYTSAIKVVAFASHFEHYIRTGEQQEEKE